MLCQKIIETLEARYPGSCAMDWDNVGLLVGRRKKKCIAFMWQWMQRMK